ncbi:hypothetical protein [Viridibacillus arvi]|uniref:hypothetical protein n=1 Tax=Viridibacillus arvi TaxID=263475 RepID=UPI003CFE0CCC
MVEYERMYWDSLKVYNSSVIIIDTEQPGFTKQLDLEESKREELLVVNKYIEHSSNNYGNEGLVIVYDILDRAVDNQDNLILFVKKNAISYPR